MLFSNVHLMESIYQSVCSYDYNGHTVRTGERYNSTHLIYEKITNTGVIYNIVWK